MSHPPFTFKLLAFVPGELKARGYVNGKAIAESVRKTPEQAYQLKLWIDESGKALQSGCNDLVFAYAAVVDEEGTVLPLAENNIRFSVIGDAEIIGSNPIHAEAGIATILLKAGTHAGVIQLQAYSEGLKEGQLLISAE